MKTQSCASSAFHALSYKITHKIIVISVDKFIFSSLKLSKNLVTKVGRVKLSFKGKPLKSYMPFVYLA